MKFRQSFRFMIAILLAAGHLIAQAQQADEAWSPPEDGFDWIKLESGEWLKGEIKSMYNDTLEFDSDNLGLLAIDWADVHQLRSAEESGINVEDIGPVSGRLQIDEETVTLTSQGKTQNFSRLNLVSLSPSGDSEIDLWSFDLAFSFNARQGNTDQIDYNSRFAAKRRTASSRVNVDYVGNISKTDAGTDELTETVNNNRITAGWDIYSTRYFYYTPLFADYYRDPFQNIDRRVTAGFGIGYTIIDTNRIEWNVKGGPAYVNIKYISVLATGDREADGGAVVVSTDYSNELSSHLDFSFKYNLSSASSQLGGYTHYMIASFETELTSSLDFDVSLSWDRIGKPTADSDGNRPVPDDYRMMLGLSWSL